jgi:hypothetical protein
MKKPIVASKKNQKPCKDKIKKVADTISPKTQTNVAEEVAANDTFDEETLMKIDIEYLSLDKGTSFDDMYLANHAANESARMYD